jgi:hypothetical protein
MKEIVLVWGPPENRFVFIEPDRCRVKYRDFNQGWVSMDSVACKNVLKK